MASGISPTNRGPPSAGSSPQARITFFQSVLESMEKRMRTRYGASREPCTMAVTEPFSSSSSMT
jgi:hypothetical protein